MLFVRDDSWGLGAVWSAAGYGHWEANTCSSLDNLLQVWRKTSCSLFWHPLTRSSPNPSSSLFLPDSLAHQAHLPRMLWGLQMHPSLTYNTNLYNCQHLKNCLCFFDTVFPSLFPLSVSLRLQNIVWNASFEDPMWSLDERSESFLFIRKYALVVLVHYFYEPWVFLHWCLTELKNKYVDTYKKDNILKGIVHL